MNAVVVFFLFAWTMNSFAADVKNVSITVGDVTLESFVNLVIGGIKKDCENVQESSSASAGIVFFSKPIIVQTQDSSYQVKSFKAEIPRFDSEGFVGLDLIKSKQALISNLKAAKTEMLTSENVKGRVLLQTQPNAIELHHPTGKIILFLLSTTGTADADSLTYNPQSDERLQDF